MFGLALNTKSKEWLEFWLSANLIKLGPSPLSVISGILDALCVITRLPVDVVTPATLTLSKLVCPSTSKSPFTSRVTVVVTPETFNDVAVEDVETKLPILYVSVPVPTTPFTSLLTNYNQLPACAK